ncbi:MAG: hypothetical protein LBQ38_13585 [Spirochaetaceae bacterium]|jgi:hypothetical protein|nr:hypothetical protein [Spirochaetaceae bacterium]
MKFIRFLYLNIYAFVLMALAALCFALPPAVFLLVVKILLGGFCAASSGGMFFQFKKKTELAKILVKRSRDKFRPDTFRYHTKTFCGELMVHAALSDLRKTENYRSLPKDEWKAYRARVFKSAKRKRKRSRC